MVLLEVLRWSQLLAAFGILALAVRTAQILSTGPLEDIGLELLYLRTDDLLRPGFLLLSAVLLEAYEFLYPWMTGWFSTANLSAWSVAINGIQALLLLGAAVEIHLRIREYTAAGQRRHLRATLDDLAERRGPQAPPQETPIPEDEDVDEA